MGESYATKCEEFIATGLQWLAEAVGFQFFISSHWIELEIQSIGFHRKGAGFSVADRSGKLPAVNIRSTLVPKKSTFRTQLHFINY